MFLNILIFYFTFYFNLIRNTFLFISFDKIAFKTLKKIFNIQAKILNFKLFQNFYNLKLTFESNQFFGKKYSKLYKNSRRILFSIKIINKFRKLKRLGNIKKLLTDLNILNIEKTLISLNLSKKNNYFALININFKNRFMIFKKFVSNNFKKK
nr:hypothetical protein CcurKRNrm3_p111 [Cryptomonas curvata]